MKLLSKILFLLTISLTCVAQNIVDCNAIIQPCISVWQDECIMQLSTQEIVTIADMLLLTYQVVQASVIMAQARLVIQAELLNIVTLSINDSFDVRIQVQKNDLTNIKNAVTTIEQAQEKIKIACKSLKNFAPLLVNINPTAIQLFISNLKNVILIWGKTQQETVAELKNIKQELIKTIDIFSDTTNIFDTIIATEPIEHSQLLQGTNSLTKMYKNTENIFASLTAIRQESIESFNDLITLYFKSHYQILYDCLKYSDYSQYKLITIQEQKLPEPELIFVLA